MNFKNDNMYRWENNDLSQPQAVAQLNSHKLVSFMKRQRTEANFIDRLKINYRSYICPFDRLLEMVSQDDHVFDIGCGSGHFAILLAEFTQPKSIHGIEISPELVKNAKSLVGGYPQTNVKFELYNGENLPQNISQATKIFMIDVLHHIPKANQLAFLTNIYKQMSAGSQFILKDIDAGNLLVFFNKMHDLLFAREIGNEMSLKNVLEVLKAIGFKVKSTVKNTLYVYPHYTIIAEK
uniref:Class I SAM-dependent methyltransferase n=1 Tax=Roseihalotalea indica TaxID=2867963 RepID=A0AA49JG15_9BACT|nr:class I SAM-dependent methyltransferase [Tunicatimonas sp. TK19036]